MDEQPIHHEPTDGGGSDPHQQRKEYRQAPGHIDGRILDAQHQPDSRIADGNADTVKAIFRGSAKRSAQIQRHAILLKSDAVALPGCFGACASVEMRKAVRLGEGSVGTESVSRWRYCWYT